MALRKFSTSSQHSATHPSSSATTDDLTLKQSDAPHVKRPQNSWILYRSQKLQEYRGPKKEQASYSQMLAAQWAAEPLEVKEYYKRLSEKMKEEHALANPGYKYKPKSKAEKDAIREAKRLEREEEKRRKAEQRTNGGNNSGGMPIRTKRKVATHQRQSSADDDSSSTPSSESFPDTPSDSSRGNLLAKQRVASPKPNHYQPYRLPGSYYPASAYGPQGRKNSGPYSTRLTPPLSSAGATPQTANPALPLTSDSNQDSVVFSAPNSLYSAVPILGTAYTQPPASMDTDANNTDSRSIPLSPPEEPIATSLPKSNVIPNQPLNPAELLSLWPSIEAGFNWAAAAQMTSDASIDSSNNTNAEFFQWSLPSDSSSLPNPSLPNGECPNEMTLTIPQSSLALPPSANNAIGPEQLVNGLSLTDGTSPATIAPTSLTPPVEAGQIPLAINFPPGFALPPVSIESLSGGAGGFWDAFVASNLPGANTFDNGNGTINGVSTEQFGMFTGAGGPALNVNGFTGADGGLMLDFDNLEWTTFSRVNGEQDGGEVVMTGGQYDAEVDSEMGNFTFSSMVNIPSSEDEDNENHPTTVKGGSNALQITTYSPESPSKAPYVPPSGASKFASRRVAGNWKPTLPLVPNNYNPTDMSAVDSHPWKQPVNDFNEQPHQYENYRPPQQRRVSEQCPPQSFNYRNVAPRAQSAAPPSANQMRSAHSTQGPPPIPPRPAAIHPRAGVMTQAS